VRDTKSLLTQFLGKFWTRFFLNNPVIFIKIPNISPTSAKFPDISSFQSKRPTTSTESKLTSPNYATCDKCTSVQTTCSQLLLVVIIHLYECHPKSFQPWYIKT